MGEFDLIEKYFLPLAMGRNEAAGFKNDAAVLDIPAGKQLVVTSDTLTAGVHFFADQTPETIAKKALRSNISDLIAMGAESYCYQLCLSLPEMNEAWLSAFSLSLAQDQAQYGLFLSGGDTTSTAGPLSISITAFGLVDEGKALTRRGAKEGDYIVLSGEIGDAWCGLQHLRGELSAPKCVQKYYIPEIPAALTPFLADYASAALDISDGLIADLGHMASASGLAAQIELQKMVFSGPAAQLIAAGSVSTAQLLTGGDDYALVMAVAPDKYGAFCVKAAEAGIKLQHIGKFKSGASKVSVLDKTGGALSFEKAGWQHF